MDLPTNKLGILQPKIVKSMIIVTMVLARGPMVNSVTAARGFLSNHIKSSQIKAINVIKIKILSLTDFFLKFAGLE